MSHTDDWRVGGIWPLQHHDDTFSVGARSCMAGQRVHARTADNLTPGVSGGAGTYGDIQGGLLWKEASAGAREYLHSWFITGSPAITTQGSAGDGTPGGSLPADAVQWRPIKSEAYDADTRYEVKTPAQPSYFGTSRWPKGWTFEVGAGTEEFSQEEVLHPDFWGLVSVNKTGNPLAGTAVYDLDENGVPFRLTRFHSLASVISVDTEGDIGVPEGEWLALQLGPSRIDESPGWLLMVDHEHQEIACGRVDQGGPFTTGRGNASCPHTDLGDDADGNNIQPLHLAAGDGNPCGTLWLFPGQGDAPLHFQEAPYETNTEPSGDDDWREVVLRYDSESAHAIAGNTYAGLWRWQVNVGGAGGGGGGVDEFIGGATGFVGTGGGSYAWGDFGEMSLSGTFGTDQTINNSNTSGASFNGTYAAAHAATMGTDSLGLNNEYLFYSMKGLPAGFSGTFGANGHQSRIRISGLTGTGATVRLTWKYWNPTTNPTGSTDWDGSSTTYTADQAWTTLQCATKAELESAGYAAGDQIKFKLVVTIDVDAVSAGFALWMGHMRLDMTQ